MALCRTDSGSLDLKGRFFDVDEILASRTSRALVYRCESCGGEIAYDALAALCQCGTECDQDNSAEFGT